MRRTGGYRSGWGLIAAALLVGGAATAGLTAFRVRPAEPAISGHASGSGFAVAPGAVVTNAHVTLRCRAAGRAVSVGDAGTWRVVAEDPQADLALLKGPGGPAPLALSAVTHLPPGTQVLVFGHPPDTAAVLPRATPGHVLRAGLTVHQPETGQATVLRVADASGHEVPPSWADGLAFFGAAAEGRMRWVVQVDAAAAPGASGGPVIDGAGAVVGVVFAGGGSEPTSAVPLADLKDFLARAGIVPLFAAPAADWPAAYAAGAGAVVRLGC